MRSLTNSPDGTGIQDLRAVLGEGVADALQAANQLNEREEVMEGEPSGKTSPSMHLNSEQDALFDSDGWLEGSRHRQEMQIGRIIDGEFVYDDEEEDGEDDDEEEEEEDEEDE